MISIIVMVMIFLSFAVVVSYNIMTVNHNLVVSTELNTIDQELKLIKHKLIRSAIPIVSRDEYALPAGDDYVNEHRLPSNIGIPLKNSKGYFFQYCPYGISDSSIKTEKISQNDGSSYSVLTTEISGLKYATYTQPAPLNDNAPDVAAFVISKFESSVVNCSDIKYDVNADSFYLTNAKVATITKDAIELYNSSDLSTKNLSVIVDNDSAQTIFDTISNDQSNRNYSLKLESDVNLLKDVEIEKNARSNIIINLNGHSLSSKTIAFTNVHLDLYSKSLKANNIATHLELSNSDVNLSKVSFGGLYVKDSEVYINDSYTNVIYQNHIDVINSKVNIQKIFKFSTSQSFNSLFNLVGSELLVNGDIQEDNAKRVGKHLILVDSGSSVHIHDSEISLTKSVGMDSNVFEIKGRLTTSSADNSLFISDSGDIQHIFNVDGGSLYLDSFKSTSDNHKGFTVNQELENSSVVIKNKNTLSSGISGCLRTIKDKITDSKIVKYQNIEAC